MATRDAASNTDLTESTWTSGGGITKATVGYTTIANTNVIHWAHGITNAAVAIPHLALTGGFGTLDGCLLSNASDYSQMLASMFVAYGGGGGGVSQILSNVLIGSAGAVKEKHTHVLVLELRDEDEHAESLGTSTTTSADFADGNKVTLTFTTPDPAVDYLIIADAQLKHGNTSQSLECRLDIDGTARHLGRFQTAVTTEWRPWSCVLGAISGETQGRLSAGASHTLKIQFRSRDGSTTAEIRQARILCLRLDTFKNFYYKEALSRQTNTTTSYVTKLNHAPTIINGGNHLIFASTHIDGATAFNTDGRITSGGTILLEPTVNSQNNLGRDDYSCAMYRMESLSAGASATNTWNVDIKKAASGVGAAGCEHAAICVIELAEAGRIVSIGEAFSRSRIAYMG